MVSGLLFFTVYDIWMKLHRYVEQQRLHITTKDRHSYLSSSWVIRPWLIWKMFLTCSSFTIWNIWMKLHRYVDHQRIHIVTKDVISLSISVLLLFRHYISHKITFGAPSSGGYYAVLLFPFVVLNGFIYRILCLCYYRPYTGRSTPTTAFDGTIWY